MQYQYYSQFQQFHPALFPQQSAPLSREPYPAASDPAFPPASASSSKSAFVPMPFEADDHSVLTQFPLNLDDRAIPFSTASYPLSHALPQSIPEPTSPDAPWEDTPKTAYKMSPQTEVGDGDLGAAYYDSDDEDLVVRDSRPQRVQSPQDKEHSNSFTPPAIPAQSAYTIGDLNNQQHLDPARMRLFTSQLQEDIKTASLFASSIPPATFSPLAQSAMPAQVPNPIPRVPAAVAHPQMGHATDVTIGPTANGNLARKPSMHLQQPSQPINPYQRPLARAPSPIRPYPAAMIDPNYLRRFRNISTAQPTLSLKDLVRPDAQFHFSPDPAAAAAELMSPKNYELDALVLEYDEDTDVDESLFTPSTERIMYHHRAASVDTVAAPALDFTTPMTRAGTKRPREVFASEAEDAQHESDDDDYEADDDEDLDDGDEYKASSKTRAAVAAAGEPASKRARLSTGAPVATRIAEGLPTTPIESTATRSRTSTTTTTKARTRHLQPGLVRANGCLHGCDLTFSTAYEARRHQEDFHGREEAYKLISQQRMQPEKPVLPCDYRFVIQIGLSHNVGVEKWDNKTKAEFAKAAQPSVETEQLPKHLVNALMDFAQEWTKRYECAMCGTSFSRLDSKKRHYAKQCTPSKRS